MRSWHAAPDPCMNNDHLGGRNEAARLRRLRDSAEASPCPDFKPIKGAFAQERRLEPDRHHCLHGSAGLMMTFMSVA
jgi:hypothetical protein